MNGDERIIEALNEILSAELAAINQYFLHAKMCANWGYRKLAAKKRAESMEEMGHADRVIDRILFLEGAPNMQRTGPIRVGEDPVEQHRVDLALELEATERLNGAIVLAREARDSGTRELLESLLGDEEESVDWLEAQLHLIEAVGAAAYLAEQIRD